MSVQILRDTQTRNGRLVVTSRTWVAANGHQVTVLTDSCVNARASMLDRMTAYSRHTYKCECGREMSGRGTPKKAHLANHDAWFTQAQIEQVKAALQD